MDGGGGCEGQDWSGDVKVVVHARMWMALKVGEEEEFELNSLIKWEPVLLKDGADVMA